VLDLHITHDRFGRRSDPSLNGHLNYLNDLDGSLNEAADNKIRQYRTDYIIVPLTLDPVCLMSAIVSTSGSLHSEFVRLLFSEAHRETDRFRSTGSANQLPLPSRRVLLTAQVKGRRHPRQGCSNTD